MSGSGHDKHGSAHVERALQLLDEARDRCGHCHPEVARRLSEVGVALAEDRRLREAEDAFRQSLALLRLTDDANDERAALVECRLGALLEATGRLEEAELLFRRAAIAFASVLGADDEHTLAADDRHTDLVRRMQLPQ